MQDFMQDMYVPFQISKISVDINFSFGSVTAKRKFRVKSSSTDFYGRIFTCILISKAHVRQNILQLAREVKGTYWFV